MHNYFIEWVLTSFLTGLCACKNVSVLCRLLQPAMMSSWLNHDTKDGVPNNITVCDEYPTGHYTGSQIYNSRLYGHGVNLRGKVGCAKGYKFWMSRWTKDFESTLIPDCSKNTCEWLDQVLGYVVQGELLHWKFYSTEHLALHSAAKLQCYITNYMVSSKVAQHFLNLNVECSTSKVD